MAVNVLGCHSSKVSGKQLEFKPLTALVYRRPSTFGVESVFRTMKCKVSTRVEYSAHPSLVSLYNIVIFSIIHPTYRWICYFATLYYVTRIISLLLVTSLEGEIVNLTKVTRSEMGAYLCIAANGVPPSVSKRIMLHVHCKYTQTPYYYFPLCFWWSYF